MMAANISRVQVLMPMPKTLLELPLYSCDRIRSYNHAINYSAPFPDRHSFPESAYIHTTTFGNHG